MREAERLQFGGRQGRRLAALHHVGEQRQPPPKRLGDAGEVVAAARRLDEQHVGAGLAVHLHALDGAVEAFDRDGVGARHDQGLARVAGIHRGADFSAHLGGRDQRLAVEMAAALGKVLVLELDRGGAGALELAHGAHDVERIAVAGVGIDHEMRIDAVADQRQRLRHLGHGDEADVGPAEPGVGDRGAGDIERREARLRGDQRGERIVHAGRHDDGLAGKTGAERFGVSHGHIPT